MQEIVYISSASQDDVDGVISGESGTGKELRPGHPTIDRRGTFVSINGGCRRRS